MQEQHPRQCVFCGTTNEQYFLKGNTGNRRFWVIPVDAARRKHANTREALQADRDQLWAEAVWRYKHGEALYLNADMEVEARGRQENFNDDSDDPLEAMVKEFLDMKLPPDWYTWDINRRRAYIKNPDPLDATGTEMRVKMCTAEFLCEVVGISMADKGYKYEARRVNAIMERQEGWAERLQLRFPVYGRQRAYIRQQCVSTK